jgi:hypothetical protein
MGNTLSRRTAALITTTAMAVITSTVLAGCGGGSSASGGGSGEPAEGRIVALMVDQTCDASPQLTQFSVDALHASVDAAAQDKGTFLGEAITTDEYQKGTFAIAHNFTSDRANDAGQRRDLRNQVADFESGPEGHSLTQGYKPGTKCGSDLINAMTAAERAFSGTPGASTRTKDLVFVTNGILQEKDVDFVHDTLNQNAINALVAKKKKQGLLPDLTGVRVHYVGLGVADRPITAPQVKAIESFWVAFAKRAGATDVTSVRAGNQVALPSAGDAE